jgi:hypothetical protein
MISIFSKQIDVICHNQTCISLLYGCDFIKSRVSNVVYVLRYFLKEFFFEKISK